MNEEQSRLHLLTPAEIVVLHWLGEGKRNSEIAIILNRSEGTIRTHVQNILHKLGVESRYMAALHYRRFSGPT